jgi:hypothetical protein
MDGLTPTTRGATRVLEQAPLGGVVDLSDLPDKERAVSGPLVRQLFVGPSAESADPRGLTIRHARIVGSLDLELCNVLRPITFEHTMFEEMPVLARSRIPGLTLEDCLFPGLDANEIEVRHQVVLRSCHATGGVSFSQAKIGGDLQCSSATLANEGADALVAQDAQVGGTVWLDEGFSATGWVSLLRAKIGGDLQCSSATLANEGGDALYAEDAQVGGTVWLDAEFSATGLLSLLRAKIGGDLQCSSATLANEGADALFAQGAQVASNVWLDEGFSSAGGVSFSQAKIGGDLRCSSATIANEGADALFAPDAQVGGTVWLDAGFSATGRVSFVRARISGDLQCSSATLANEGADAFLADGAQVNGTVLLNDGFIATGLVSLFRAKIGGDLQCSSATLANEGRNALFAQDAQVGGTVWLDAEFSATGLLSLLRAKIGGDLQCSSATLANEGENALLAQGAQVASNVWLDEGFSSAGGVSFSQAKIGGDLRCSSATIEGKTALDLEGTEIGQALVLRDTGLSGAVDLSRARASSLDDDLGTRGDLLSGTDMLGSWSGASPLRLEGFAYARFSRDASVDTEARFRWLAKTDTFEPGAWQQLAEVYRIHGRENDATRTAIAMHDDRLHRGNLSRPRKLGRWTLRFTVGHGYRPWIAGLWAVAIILLFALAVWSVPHVLLPAQEPDAVQGQVVAQRPEAWSASRLPRSIIYSADTLLPVIDFGEADRWDAVGWLLWMEWLVIFLGWILTTLFVAGFTKIVRT